jgi:hypothetical protein
MVGLLTGGHLGRSADFRGGLGRRFNGDQIPVEKVKVFILDDRGWYRGLRATSLAVATTTSAAPPATWPAGLPFDLLLTPWGSWLAGGRGFLVGCSGRERRAGGDGAEQRSGTKSVVTPGFLLISFQAWGLQVR